MKMRNSSAKAHPRKKGGTEKVQCSRRNLLGQSKFTKQQLSVEKGRACPGPELPANTVATCPEPGPRGLTTLITEDKKEKYPFLQGITVELAHGHGM